MFVFRLLVSQCSFLLYFLFDKGVAQPSFLNKHSIGINSEKDKPELKILQLSPKTIMNSAFLYQRPARFAPAPVNPLPIRSDRGFHGCTGRLILDRNARLLRRR
jgi:hypothetical protein